MDKIGICTFSQYHGREQTGSSKIRGEWLTKYWEGAELFKQGQKYDVVIYQKAYWVEHAKEFKGIKILDLCDPDFLEWQYRTKEMIDEVDAITTSTEKLAEAFRKFTDKPVICIPDRVDMEEHKQKKYHVGRAKWAVWYGYSHNFGLVKPALHFLKKYGLNLIVISDNTFSISNFQRRDVELRNLPYNTNTVNDDITSGDIVLNPQSSKGKWRFKSNNKTIGAWALGMPVAHNIEELKNFLTADARKAEAERRLKEVQENWDVKKSVEEFKNLIKEIRDKK